MCINFGSVGFLSSIEFDEIPKFLPSIIAEAYQVEKRSVLQISIRKNDKESKDYFALNDLVIRSDPLHISRQLLRVDGGSICSYEGDGLIVATSTGSTGYALSAGASIVEPSLEVFIINPLISRKQCLSSLIISMNHELELICRDPKPWSKIYIDGQELAPLQNGESIHIRSAGCKAKFAVLDRERYFRLLHQRCI